MERNSILSSNIWKAENSDVWINQKKVRLHFKQYADNVFIVNCDIHFQDRKIFQSNNNNIFACLPVTVLQQMFQSEGTSLRTQKSLGIL